MEKRAMVAAAAVLAMGLAVPTPGVAQYDGGEKMQKTIVEIAAGNADFETLVTAVKAAGLAETLGSTGPFTVFAPTDAAFAALPEGTLEALLADKDALTAVLTYHVIPGKVMAQDVLAAEQVRPATVQGDLLNVRVMGGSVMVDEATVIQPDIEASNGVIHAIDRVVLPSSMKAASAKR